MPELPEVEAARRDLGRWFGDAPIDAAEAVDPAAVRAVLSTRPSDALAGGASVFAGLAGATITAIHRHGKRLLVIPDRGPAWLAHLGMTGQFVRAEAPRFVRLRWRVGGQDIAFVDARRFGAWAPVPATDGPAALRAGHGPDALDDPPEAWAPGLRGRRAIKTIVMDQAVVAGVGNIHAVEALWRAQIHPDTAGDALDPAARLRLAVQIRDELAEAVAAIDGVAYTYVNQGGENPFDVYQRAGAPCRRCGAAITEGRHAGRGTFWCPTCQPAVEGGAPRATR